jgi:hypothetical protein
MRRTRITNERQDLDPSPLGRYTTNFILDCTTPDPIPTPLWKAGNGKPAGSRRRLPK